MYSALTEIIDNPRAVALSLIISTALFFASRLIIDGLNSGWSRRVVNELDVLERMKKAELGSDSKGAIAISSIESYISRMVINSTTRRDRSGNFFEALQFSVIGAFLGRYPAQRQRGCSFHRSPVCSASNIVHAR